MFNESPELLEKAASYLRERGSYMQGRTKKAKADRRNMHLLKRELHDAALNLIADPCFPSDRARARVLAGLHSTSEAAAQSRIARLRKSLMYAAPHDIQNP